MGIFDIGKLGSESESDAFINYDFELRRSTYVLFKSDVGAGKHRSTSCSGHI